MKKTVTSLIVLACILASVSIVNAQSENEAHLLYKKGDEAHRNGKFEEALTYHERSLSICKSIKNSGCIADNLNDIGYVYTKLYQYDKALTYYEEALEVRKSLGIPYNVATGLTNIGFVYKYFGKYAKALTYYEEALEIYKKHGSPFMITQSLINISSVYSALGKHKKARTYHEEARKIVFAPSYSDELKKMAKRAITQLHALLDDEKYLEIYHNMMSGMARNTARKTDLISVMKTSHDKWGDVVRINDSVENVLIDPFLQVRIICNTTFKKGEVTEMFNWLIMGTKVMLISYEISPGPVDLEHLK